MLDLQLPDMSGVEVTRGLRAAHPAAHVLVLSASGEQQNVLDAVKAGAVGYLLKSAARAEFLDAVRRTAGGDAVFTPGLAALALGEFRRLAAAPASDEAAALQLTERETEILRMVATGLSYKQIATRLVLSHRTVQNHVQNTLGKLQLHNRVELVRYAIERLADEPQFSDSSRRDSRTSSRSRWVWIWRSTMLFDAALVAEPEHGGALVSQHGLAQRRVLPVVLQRGFVLGAVVAGVQHAQVLLVLVLQPLGDRVVGAEAGGELRDRVQLPGLPGSRRGGVRRLPSRRAACGPGAHRQSIIGFCSTVSPRSRRMLRR